MSWYAKRASADPDVRISPRALHWIFESKWFALHGFIRSRPISVGVSHYSSNAKQLGQLRAIPLDFDQLMSIHCVGKRNGQLL